MPAVLPAVTLVNLRRLPFPDQRMITQVEVTNSKPGEGFRAETTIYQYRHDVTEGQRAEVIRSIRAAADSLTKLWGIDA